LSFYFENFYGALVATQFHQPHFSDKIFEQSLPVSFPKDV
jgi:hypothetical protein